MTRHRPICSFDLDGAIEDYDRAIAPDPRDAAAYYNRGLARRDNGDLAGAIDDFERYLELAPRVDDVEGVRRRINQLRELAAAGPPPAIPAGVPAIEGRLRPGDDELESGEDH